MMRRSSLGFTLFEVMLAIMIGVMVLAIALPSIDGLLDERRARASFEAFDGLVRQAVDESLEQREARRLVWERERIVLASGESAVAGADAPSIPIGKNESYRVELPAALVPKPSADWTVWPTGTCEPAIIHYEGAGVKWSAVYDPLTVHAELTTDES